MAVDMGPDRSRREAQLGGDHGRTVSLQPHIVDGDFILQSHSDTPSVMTAKLWGEQPQRTTLPGWIILRLPLRECR